MVNTHEVKAMVQVGESGLGLVLGKEKEGSRWVVNGFRPMPNGAANPAEVSLGDGGGGDSEGHSCLGAPPAEGGGSGGE